ncbi:MAG: malto-oligosyltrehalose trehalohydrolase [Myxococcales bacterium]|nr:malto-oligosyltrehalose trehalohydrolase [Myxococcales bacterium]
MSRARHPDFPALGAFPCAGGVVFRVWVRRADRVSVVLYTRGPHGPVPLASHPLVARGGGVFEATVPGLGPGALYKFRLGRRELPDPYARALPYGVHGPAEVVAPARVDRGPWRPRPLAECVIYELHVGTFTPEGTFAAATTRLAELAELGVTAIELLPVSSFSGRRGWGYDGVAHFAPHPAYGRPDDLRAMIREAHRLGMNALLDVVYNHFGPDGNYLASYHPGYFAQDHWTPWGQALDFACPATRKLVLDNALYWFDEFGLDGLRLDATHAMRDRSELDILKELATVVRARGRGELLIAEDETNHPDLVLATGLDALWADDFHHIVHTLLTGERDGYYAEYPPTLAALARCLTRGFYYEGAAWQLSGRPRGGPSDRLPGASLLFCLQNHDQIGNRALGERLHHLVPLDVVCAATAVLLFVPMTPLLFMGQEWAASTPWQFFTDHPPDLGARVTAGRRSEYAAFAAFADESRRHAIPDPQAESTFKNSVLRWHERALPPHAAVLALHRRLLHLRRDDSVISRPDREDMSVETSGTRLLVRRRGPAGARLLIIDLGPSPDLRPPEPGWAPLLDTGGPGLPPARAAIYASA